jgi:thiamine biosynthesis lipoprotein
MTVVAKDIPEADSYIDMAVAETSRLEHLISD